jgi:hypothetical protein
MEGFCMKVREGIIPAVLGAAVTATGIAVRMSKPALGWGIAGFGLAHIVLGAIDIVEYH